MALVRASDLINALKTAVAKYGDCPVIFDSDWSPIDRIELVKKGEYILGNDTPWLIIYTDEMFPTEQLDN